MRLHSRIPKAILFIAALGLAVAPLDRAGAASPESAVYSQDSSRIFWIMHISDSHIGSEWFSEDQRFVWALEEAAAVIDPVLIINTGDLCDGSLNGIPATGQGVDEWSLYRQILDDAGMTTDIYIDIPGNHDAYGDGGHTFYLTWSLNGETFNTTTRSMLLGFPFGDYFIYGTATSGEDGAIIVDHHEFSQAELTEMDDELTANDNADLIFVFGHHPIELPTNAAQAIQIVQQHKAFYFHGHIHSYGSYIQDNIVVAQVDSLGKATHNNLVVIAVDNNAVSYAPTSSDDPWPFVVVTAPANRMLDSGEITPYAYEVGTNCTDNPVRALVFDQSAISAVTFEPPGGQPRPMQPHPTIDHLYVGSWDTTGLPTGEATLTVTAHASQVRSRQVNVMLSAIACTSPVEDPDAGVPDGGHMDGSVDTDGATGDNADAGDDQDGSAIGGGSDSGCNCRSASPAGTPPLPWIFLAVVGLLVATLPRRRR